MKCIIPLAGPDIYTKKYGLKPAYEIDGEPLLFRALHSRNWYGHSLNEEDLIFVLRDFEQLNELKKLIASYFPKGRQLIIPDFTCGALMSSMAGASLITNFREAIVVDLVDILFSSDFEPETIFNGDKNISGIIPYFRSDNHKYSYLKLSKNQNVLRTQEKEVISNNASAGVYFFRDTHSFLKALSYSLVHKETLSYNNLLYLCPSFNGLIKRSGVVKAVEVDDVRDISTFLL